MSRYNVKYIYGRYEIQDRFNDHCIGYSYRQEDAQLVCNAMNKQYETDTKSEK